MDREKVIAWLADEELYYRDHGDTHNSLMACDVLALIKEQEEQIDTQRKNLIILLNEQEAVEPTWSRGKPFCGACGLQIRGEKFCSECGKPIAWEGR